jgi:amidase
MARNAKPPFATREEAMRSPFFEKVNANARKRWQQASSAEAHYNFLLARERLMFNLLNAMAEHRVDAIVHKPVEHLPTLIKQSLEPAWIDGRGAPHLNTFVVFVPSISVPAGFTAGNLPVGLCFLGRPYEDGRMLGYAYAYEQATQHRRPPAGFD